MKLDQGVVIIAPNSLVGSKVVDQFTAQSILVQKIDHQGGDDSLKADITNQDQLIDALRQCSGSVVINFAAATAVDEIEKNRPQNLDDKAELESNSAYLINVLGTKALMEACRQTNKIPVFISTDFVFDGQNGPYSEDDQVATDPNLISWYGWTKLLAEKEIDLTRSLVIRIAYPYRQEYSLKGDLVRNFLKQYDQFKAGELSRLIQPFADQLITPTLVDDLGPALIHLIDQDQRGIFHLASPDSVNVYQFFCEALKIGRGVENPEGVLEAGSLKDYMEQFPDKAKRPIKGGLSSQKLVETGFTPTNWREGLIKVFANR